MGKAFHYVGGLVTSLIAIVMIVMGTIWILQGFGIAFLDSFMANDVTWARNGAILAAIGLVQLGWATTRKGYFTRR